jgi:excisionase family DNA binding protein
MSHSDDWITLHEAAELLGVHPATVRHWSDQGRLPVYRTSGGHRRYKRNEVELWAKSARQSGKRSPEETMQLAIRQIRVRIAEGQLEAEGWYQKLDEAARLQYRQSGATLARGLMAQLLAHDEQASAEAQALGYEYAARARAHGLGRVEAVQAFLFFKNALIDGLMQVFSDAHVPTGEAWHTLSRLTLLTDQILLALLSDYRAPNGR